MMAQTAVKERQAAQGTTGKLSHTTPATSNYVPGRRDFFKYRDLAVTQASNGALRAQVMSSSQGLSRPTGWHYHECDGQFIYVLTGWVDLEFENGDKLRVNQGDSLYIPGGMKHNETATSSELEILEVSIPGEMGTVPVERPTAA